MLLLLRLLLLLLSLLGGHATRRNIAVAIPLAFNKRLQQHMRSTTLGPTPNHIGRHPESRSCSNTSGSTVAMPTARQLSLWKM